MDLAKFVWLLQRRALFFARSDNLGDPYEGHYTRAMALGEEQFIAAVQPPPNQHDSFRSIYRGYLERIKLWRPTLYVSSWHMNEVESAAMWRLYTTLNEAICITSTFKKLEDALPGDAFFGVVGYIDYERDGIRMNNSLNYIMHKRMSYAHEREARAVIWTADEGIRQKYPEVNAGIVVPVDLTEIIVSVYVSPSSSALVREIVDGLLRTYGPEVPVLQSEANAPPPY